jgi:hypothetical protein
VGLSDGGPGWSGPEKVLVVVGTGTIQSACEHSGGTVCRAERRRRLVMAARRTLYWTSVIRWSGARGKIIFVVGGVDDPGNVLEIIGLGGLGIELAS